MKVTVYEADVPSARFFEFYNKEFFKDAEYATMHIDEKQSCIVIRKYYSLESNKNARKILRYTTYDRLRFICDIPKGDYEAEILNSDELLIDF